MLVHHNLQHHQLVQYCHHQHDQVPHIIVTEKEDMEETIFNLNRKKIKKQTGGGIDVHRQLGWKSLITAVAPQLHDAGWQAGWIALLAERAACET